MPSKHEVPGSSPGGRAISNCADERDKAYCEQKDSLQKSDPKQSYTNSSLDSHVLHLQTYVATQSHEMSFKMDKPFVEKASAEVLVR